MYYLIYFARFSRRRVRQAGKEMHRTGTVDSQEALIHILIGIQITQSYKIFPISNGLLSLKLHVVIIRDWIMWQKSPRTESLSVGSMSERNDW